MDKTIFIIDVIDEFCTCFDKCKIKSQDQLYTTEFLEKINNEKKKKCNSDFIYDSDKPKNIDPNHYLEKIHYYLNVLVAEELLDVFTLNQNDNPLLVFNNQYKLRNKNDGNSDLSWTSISQLDTNSRILFWYLRKGITDALILYLIHFNYNNRPLKVLSVGSNNLSSDYDITLYGINGPFLSEEFNDYIKLLFGNTADIVFDTNLYFSSFIELFPPINTQVYTKTICDNIPMWILLSNDSVIVKNQHIWAALKIMKAIRNQIHIDDEYKNNIYRELQMFIENDVLDFSTRINKLYNIISNLSLSTSSIFIGSELKKQGFTQNVQSNLDLEISNNSLINFKSPETYFTRGAFLDTVINTQMCQKSQKIQLCIDDYWDSILENIADFCIHNGTKEKYITRIKDAINNAGLLQLHDIIGTTNFRFLLNTSLEILSHLITDDDLNTFSTQYNNRNLKLDLTDLPSNSSSTRSSVSNRPLSAKFGNLRSIPSSYSLNEF